MAPSGDAVSLLREVVRIPSVSKEEAACRDHLVAWLGLRGVPAEARGRNVVAVIEGKGPPGRGLLLMSHIDVVPVGSGWTFEPWSGEVANGRVLGRGANDAKSSCAAMAAAVARVDPASLSGRIVLALVCDEETGGEGIEAIRDRLPAFSASVVGEPTGLDVCPGQRGLLRAAVVAKGRAAHASRPHEGVNAIERAAHDVLAIQSLDLGAPDPLLGAPTLQATMIEGGLRHNMIPAECTIQLDGRPTPGCDNKRMLERLRAAVKGEVVVKSTRFEPVVTAADAEIVRVAREASPSGTVRAFAGVSDLFWVRHVPGVVMGPGTSAMSHAPDESVAVEQVEAAEEAYGEILAAYLGARPRKGSR